jgi:myo-inositol-1-phosphate synthase
MGSIRVAIVGVGNCASALVQGLVYYRERSKQKSGTDDVDGLISTLIGGYSVGDIEVVAAFDVDSRKVGRDVAEAIFAKPNCCRQFAHEIATLGVTVQKGAVLDGVAEHSRNGRDKSAVHLDDSPEASQADVVRILRETGCEILVNYLPVGSQRATEFYLNAALEAGVGVVNAIPVFAASSREWSMRFKEKNLPIVGDDVKSQVGATITHRVLTELCFARGVEVKRTYQLNVGGNSDFYNMLDRQRLESKRISKTEAVQSVATQRLENDNIKIGPSDYVPWLDDTKVAFIRLEASGFGGSPIDVEVKLNVQDSPNSAAVIVDAIRCCRVALDRKIGGALEVPSSFLMKSPPTQVGDMEAFAAYKEFIS